MIVKSTESDHVLKPLNAAIRSEVDGHVNPTTTARWYREGIAGVDGERHKLQVWFVGRRAFTTRAAILRFLDEVTFARMAKIDSRHKSNAGVTDDELRTVGLLGRTTGGAK